jgi:hypothetical protein
MRDRWNGMCYKSWNFSTHFSTPEMLGFGHTFFCTETVTFGLQFRCIALVEHFKFFSEKIGEKCPLFFTLFSLKT